MQGQHREAYAQVLAQVPTIPIAAAPSSLATDCGLGWGCEKYRSVAMNSDEDRRRRFGRLPLALTPRARLELEMVVLDEDSLDAQEFLAEQGIEAGEAADPLAIGGRQNAQDGRVVVDAEAQSG